MNIRREEEKQKRKRRNLKFKNFQKKTQIINFSFFLF